MRNELETAQDEGTEVAFRILNAEGRDDDALLSSSACHVYYDTCGSSDCIGLLDCCNTICNCAFYG
jgi:hypothetical protein